MNANYQLRVRVPAGRQQSGQNLVPIAFIPKFLQLVRCSEEYYRTLRLPSSHRFEGTLFRIEDHRACPRSWSQELTPEFTPDNVMINRRIDELAEISENPMLQETSRNPSLLRRMQRIALEDRVAHDQRRWLRDPDKFPE